MDQHLATSALRRLRSYPHVGCGFYPTPLEELPRFRQAVGRDCPRILIKRDDYTGAGFGGNKVRKLDYVLAKAKEDGVEVAITVGSEKSNHARVTAAVCARLGIHPVVVLSPAARPLEGLDPASVSVEKLVGAEIHRVGHRAEREPMMKALTERFVAAGKRVVEIPLGASIPLGALGFIRAMNEVNVQLKTTAPVVDYIFHASSSGGTQAGLIAGAALLGIERARIVGVSPDESGPFIAGEVRAIIHGLHRLLDLPDKTIRDEALVLDEYVGEGYGIPSAESDAALRLLARTEGILLDPAYTAKAMAGLLDWVRQGRLTAEDTVLFWHTGGQLGLFYAPE